MCNPEISNVQQILSQITLTKGSILVECGYALQTIGKYEVKVFNTINFSKSMHYNPFAYIHSEKDILKLVTTLIANTKGDGKSGDEFWTKAETLLYCALIGYIHYEAPVEEQNFATLIEFINSRIPWISCLKTLRKRIQSTLLSGSIRNTSLLQERPPSPSSFHVGQDWRSLIFRSLERSQPMMSWNWIPSETGKQHCS